MEFFELVKGGAPTLVLLTMLTALIIIAYILLVSVVDMQNEAYAQYNNNDKRTIKDDNTDKHGQRINHITQLISS